MASLEHSALLIGLSLRAAESKIQKVFSNFIFGLLLSLCPLTEWSVTCAEASNVEMAPARLFRIHLHSINLRTVSTIKGALTSCMMVKGAAPPLTAKCDILHIIFQTSHTSTAITNIFFILKGVSVN